MDLPNSLFGTGGTDYELYEEDDEFVPSVELSGFEVKDIDVTWHEGVLNVAAAHEDEARGQHKTYHRRFRFPKNIDDKEITAKYTGGIPEVRLPIF